MGGFRIEGVFTALVTPFEQQVSRVDWVRYERHVDAQVACGVDGVLTCADAGERHELSEGEQHELVARAKRLAKGRAWVAAAVGASSTAQLIERARNAVDAGADALMLIEPDDQVPSPRGLLAHFQAVASSVAAPIVLSVTEHGELRLQADAVLGLAERCPNVIGLVDSTGNVAYAQRLLARSDRLQVASGDDRLAVAMASVGARGLVSESANLVPRAVVDVMREALAGRFADAAERHFRLLALHEHVAGGAGAALLKWALARRGDMLDVLRAPVCVPGPDARACAASVLERIVA